jgi:5'-methylthioadenosine phosphorylase
MEGPQFSTRAESELHRKWGASLIGMTAMPEAKLAREAELPFCAISMVTDFDSWHPYHEAVDVAKVIVVMKDNVEKAKRLVLRLASLMPREHQACAADTVLDGAIMTAPEKRDAALLSRLDAVAGRVMGEI